MNQAMPCDKAVTVHNVVLHAKVMAAMTNQFVEFLKRSFIEQQINALARGKLAFAMLFLFSFRASALFRSGMAFL